MAKLDLPQSFRRRIWETPDMIARFIDAEPGIGPFDYPMGITLQSVTLAREDA